MGRWWSQDFLCSDPECGTKFDLVVQYDDRAIPVECPTCGAPAEPVIGAPAVLERTLPDGTNRGVAWDRQKEIARLKLQRRNTKPDKRGDVDREIKKLNDKQLGKQ